MIIAHDLKGPLANLAVLIELIDTYRQVQQFERVKSATDKAQDIIEALDAMLSGFVERARVSGDPLAFRPTLVDAADVVARAASLNEPLAGARGITIDTSKLAPAVLDGDPRLLLEATDNLIGNAIKYAPANSVVRCTASRSGNAVTIAVSDTGMGLSADALKSAFRPFATLASTYKDRKTAWGLGLWIVRLIAERHGGKVDAGLCPDLGGARFEIRLPA
jgi:signal transduction histidine kinase